MTRITWDDAGQRFYESGLDHGVLYLTDGTGIPWNGLTGISEDPQEDSEPIYYDGVKIRDEQKLTEWSGTMTAITYPDEFLEYEGIAELGSGLYAHDQAPKAFGLSYRTMVRNDLDSEFGERLHIVYNITAIPDTKDYETIADDPELTEFVWKVSAAPVDVLGVRPSAHLMIDPRSADPFILTEVEGFLYGTDTTDASLMPFDELYAWLKAYVYMTITDNGDGTWTATSNDPEAIIMTDSDTFELHGVALDFNQPTDPDQYTIVSGGEKEV